METDKATVEMEAYTNGTIRKLVAAEGDTIKMGELIAVIGAPDEDISALLEAAAQAAPAPADLPRRVPAPPLPDRPRAVSRPAARAAPARRHRRGGRSPATGGRFAPRRSPSGWRPRRGSI